MVAVYAAGLESFGQDCIYHAPEDLHGAGVVLVPTTLSGKVGYLYDHIYVRTVPS